MNQLPKIQPPEFFLRFFRWYCDPAIAEDIEGDLREMFYREVTTGKPHESTAAIFNACPSSVSSRDNKKNW